MKRLVMIPGKMDRVFFLNEIKYFRNKFDDIIVLCYKQPTKNLSAIAKKYDLSFEVVKNYSVKSIFLMPFILIRNRNKFISDELKSIGKRNKFKKILFMLSYISFGINAYAKYKKYKSDKYDDVFYSFWLSRSAFAAAYIKNLMPKLKFISRAHGYDLYEEVNALSYLPFRKFIYCSSSRIFFISNYGFNYFMQKYPFASKEKLSISRLGTKNPNSLFKKINKKDIVCIASCATISRIKRLDLIIDTLSRINDIKIKWIHLGDGDLLEEIKEYAEKKLKCPYKFEGRVNNDDILGLYLKEDVDYFINLSDSEGIPVSIMEAISIGIPVIARNVGGISEIIDGNCGLLLSKDYEIDCGAKEIKEFLRIRLLEEPQYVQMSKDAIEAWSQKYNADENYSAFVDYIFSM